MIKIEKLPDKRASYNRPIITRIILFIITASLCSALYPVINFGSAGIVTGNDFKNYLFGTMQNDMMTGKGANDRMYGLAGADTINGDDGDDIIEGGQGNDDLNGDAGNDLIIGGQDADNIKGGDGND